MSIPTADTSTAQREATEAGHDALVYGVWAARAPKPSVDAVKILAAELAEASHEDPKDRRYLTGIRWSIEVIARTAGAMPNNAEAVRRHVVREAIAARS